MLYDDGLRLCGSGCGFQDWGFRGFDSRCLGFCLGFGMSSETGLSVLRASISQ